MKIGICEDCGQTFPQSSHSNRRLCDACRIAHRKRAQNTYYQRNAQSLNAKKVHYHASNQGWRAYNTQYQRERRHTRSQET